MKKFTHTIQQPRKSLWLLLIAGLGSLCVHHAVFPIWLFLLYALTGYCAHYQLTHNRPFFGGLLKLLLNIAAVSLVVVFYGSFTIDAAIGLLAVAFSLKFLELKQPRDWYTCLAIILLLLCTTFYYSKAIKTAFLVICVFLLVAMAAQTMHSSAQRTIMSRATTNIKLLFAAVPILVFFFIFFPRIAPLWSMPNSTVGKTGLSESMSPWDVSELVKSDELVFRASMSQLLDPSELYWRAFTMDEFDGYTWQRTLYADKDDGLMTTAQAQRLQKDVEAYFTGTKVPRIDVDVLLATDTKEWAYGLGLSVPADSTFKVMSDFSLYPDSKLVTHYRVNALLPQSLPMRLTEAQRRRYVSLSRTAVLENPRSAELIRTLGLKQMSAEKVIPTLENYYKQSEIVYSMSPGGYEGKGSIDNFLFDAKEGFCAHFASSLIFLLRQLDLPSRMVVGYQGGEYNGGGKFYTVRQYDAHAWVEVWMRGQGWVVIDPTRWAAPSRIEQGVSEHMLQTAQFSAGLASVWLRDNAAIRYMTQQLDQLTYAWNIQVVKFSRDRQYSLMQYLTGGQSLLKQVGIFAGILIGCLLLGFAIITFDVNLFRKQKQDPVLKMLMPLFKAGKLRYDAKLTPQENLRQLQIKYARNQGGIEQINLMINKMLFSDLSQIDRKSQLLLLKRHVKEMQNSLRA